MNSQKRITNRSFLYLLISALSLLIFIGVYGVHVINPSYTSWLFDGGELSQHYLGWVAYRKSSWHFPIGMVDNLAYPNLISVIFTDSIPLFAVFFKFLSPILPEEFQYMGLWGVMCFGLQSLLTARILEKFTTNGLAVVLGSLLSLISPIVFFRMFGHTALASQWIIIYGLGLIFNQKKANGNKIFIQTALLALISSSVHIYFVLMCGILTVGICIVEVLRNKKIFKSLGILVDYLLVSICTIWLLGGFSSGMDAQNEGLGIYSFNLNGFFDPQGWSCLLNDLPHYEGQYEGFAYLGAGFIALLVVSLILLIIDHNLRISLKENKEILLAVLMVFAISLIVALSPVITLGYKVLIGLQLPEYITDIWAVFRASGRIIWVDIYIVEIVTLIVIVKCLSEKRFLIIVLCGALILQFYDIHDKFTERYEFLGHVTEYPTPLNTKEFWDTVGQDENIKHVIYYDVPERSYMYRITEWAFDHQMTVNNYYFPRSIDEEIIACRDAALNAPSEDSIFIFPESKKMDCLKYNLHYYGIDGLIIGYINKISGYDELPDNYFVLDWFFADNLYIMPEFGTDTELGREIYPGGFSFGPYWALPAGKHLITITGVDMPKELGFDIQTEKGTQKHVYTITEQTNDTVTIEITLEHDVDDLEIVITNNSADTVVVNSIHLQQR